MSRYNNSKTDHLKNVERKVGLGRTGFGFNKVKLVTIFRKHQSVNSVTFPRHVFHPDACTYHLHGFADASEAAYGTCVYVQSLLKDGSSVSNLITAKSKVAPVKNVTIPD